MKAVLVFALLAVSVSALSRLHKMRAVAEAEDEDSTEGEWDIAEGISGAAVAMGKVEGHENSVKQAFNQLSAADKAAFTENPTKKKGFFEALHNPTAMIMGVQYPDMPIGGPNTAMLGDDMRDATHVNAVTFGTLFKAGSLGARNSFIAQTHYGCLQFWHAMAPEPYVGGKYKVWKNKDLSQLIKNSCQRIWQVVVNHVKAGNKKMAEFHVGRIAHTIGDSFAVGHTARNGACGKVIVFQEYNAQKGNEAHAGGDKPAANPAQFQCTVANIKTLLGRYAACVKGKGSASACTYPAINSIFDVDPAVAEKDAGGSLEKYAGTEAKTKGTKTTITAGGKTYTVYFPAQKGLTKIYGTSQVAQACPKF